MTVEYLKHPNHVTPIGLENTRILTSYPQKISRDIASVVNPAIKSEAEQIRVEFLSQLKNPKFTPSSPIPSASIWVMRSNPVGGGGEREGVWAHVPGIWTNQLIHSFLVECLNPCLQRTSVRVGSPQLVHRGKRGGVRL